MIQRFFWRSPMNIIEHFDILTNKGIKVIPLLENSKIPISKNWTVEWDREALRQKLQNRPNCNIGILLGKIVDVEGDTEWANKFISHLIGDYPHVSYSSSKSTHHLFLNPDEKLRIFSWKGIEFRGWGHQSVLPPSNHNGIQYQWNKFRNFSITEMPDRLLKFYQYKKYSKINLKPNHVMIKCCKCNKNKFMHKKRYDLEIEILKTWFCKKCRPKDIRPLCRKLRKNNRVSKSINILSL